MSVHPRKLRKKIAATSAALLGEEYSNKVAPVIASVPVGAGEIGENDCAGTYIDPLTTWLESENTSFLAWTWDDWSGGCSSGQPMILEILHYLEIKHAQRMRTFHVVRSFHVTGPGRTARTWQTGHTRRPKAGSYAVASAADDPR